MLGRLVGDCRAEGLELCRLELCRQGQGGMEVAAVRPGRGREIGRCRFLPAEGGPIGAGRDIDVEVGRLGDGLVILGEALSDLGGADADDRVFAGLVVRLAAEDFGADDALAEKVVLAREGMFDDVAEQGLALLGVAEGWAGEQVVERRLNARRIAGRGWLRVCLLYTSP